MRMLQELYRVLSPGGRMITFSLHSPDEVAQYLHCKKPIPGTDINLDWKVSTFRIKSSRWNETDSRRRAVSCTLAICDKPREGSELSSLPEIQLKGVLSDNDYHKLELYSSQVNLKAALKIARIDELLSCLDTVLEVSEKESIKQHQQSDLVITSKVTSFSTMQ
jgi:hypothetical protein